jgi:putative chitinase
MAFINVLYDLWPNGDSHIAGLRDGMAKSSETAFAKYGVTSTLILAHVMAQGSLECGAGEEVVENLSYSAQRMTQVWPSRFPTMASAAPYAHNPQALANKVYNGRMGNRSGSSDGWNYRGRGFTQTTGHDGYALLGTHMDLDLLENPDLVNDPALFLECGLADFTLCGCMPYARADNIVMVTKRLNGGEEDLDQRRVWLAKWKKALEGVELPT